MNFLRYDPTTGEVLSLGYMHPDLIDAEIAAGGHTIKFDTPIYFDLGTKRVDLATLQIVDV